MYEIKIKIIANKIFITVERRLTELDSPRLLLIQTSDIRSNNDGTIEQTWICSCYLLDHSAKCKTLKFNKNACTYAYMNRLMNCKKLVNKC